MKVKVVDLTNKKDSTIDLPEAIFGVSVNPVLLSQYIRVFLSRQRQGTAKAKTRGEVSGTTAKVWRQKGTGHARHGSRKAPIFVGGGKAHGPTGTQNYSLHISKKMKRAALFSALTSMVNQITVIDNLEAVCDKTKTLSTALSPFIHAKSRHLTLVLAQVNDKIIRTSNNLDYVSTTQASRLNAYEVLNTDTLIFTVKSLQKLEQTFLVPAKNAASVKTETVTPAAAAKPVKPKTAPKKSTTKIKIAK
jgi:large subunit ribosomal protein L4